MILLFVLLPAIYTAETFAQQGSVSRVKADVPSGLHLATDNGEIPVSLHLFMQPGFQAYASGANDSGELFAIRRILADLRLQHKQRVAIVLNTDFIDDVRGPVTDLYAEISEWFYRNWHTRGELFLIRFDGTVQQGNAIDFYYGSYSELGYFFGSNRYLAAHRLTGRLEVSQFYGLRGSAGATKRLYSLSLAHSWRLGSFITLQASTIYNLPDPVAKLDSSPYSNGTGLFHFMALLSIGI